MWIFHNVFSQKSPNSFPGGLPVGQGTGSPPQKQRGDYFISSFIHFLDVSSWDPILEYINDQYKKYLEEETNINRKARIPDTRVHCCLYFVAPTGHRMRPIDIEFMKRLDKCVNIVPVIAKADNLTLEEREAFRRRVSLYGSSTGQFTLSMQLAFDSKCMCHGWEMRRIFSLEAACL